VQKNGWFSFKGHALRTSSAFEGFSLALRSTEADGLYDLCYRSFRLAQVDLRQAIKTVHHVPEHPSTLSPV
jgi:hypothetical protein